MADSVHFLNGELVQEGGLMIPVRDLGFLRGYAVFDFLITYGCRPFMLERHIDRLFESARQVELSVPWEKEEVLRWVGETLAANDGAEKAIKIVVSGGVSDSLLPASDPSIIIMVDPRHLFPTDLYENGAAVITARHARYEPGAKSNNYIEGVRQAQRAAKAGAVEPIYYDERQVFEGSTSNVFARIGDSIVTPKTDILPGITREVVLGRLGLAIEQRDFSREELLDADEAFITSSNKEIMPVTAIDGLPVGDGSVGSVTTDAMRRFREFTESGEW